MINRLLALLKHESVIQFIKFGVVGLSNTVISYVIYVAALLGLQKLGLFPTIDYLIAQFIGFVLSVLWSFYWNRKYVFKPEEGDSLPIGKALLKTYLSYSFTGLILSPGLSVVLVQIFSVSKLLAPIICLFITVPLNFLLNKFWAFRANKK